jgi:hypothetical protein
MVGNLGDEVFGAFKRDFAVIALRLVCKEGRKQLERNQQAENVACRGRVCDLAAWLAHPQLYSILFPTCKPPATWMTLIQ